jgi:type I restriction enzyme S subunit
MVSYNEIISNDYVLSKDGLKWIEFNKSIEKLREKYPNILEDFNSFDGFAFPSSDYVTRFKDLQKKVKLLQIGNVNDSEWVITETQKFEYVPDKYLPNKKRYLLNKPCILISLTGGSETDNDITSYFDASFIAFLNQRVSALTMKVFNEHYFFYFYALTKSKFFKEQWLGKGGIQKNTVASDRAKTYLPKINDHNCVKFLSIITQAIINKEKLIKERHEKILNLIEQELLENQKPNKFKFELPTIKEIEEVGRLDTGVYSEAFKKIDFIVKNYENGIFFIDEKKIKSGSTPAVRYIGNIKALKYRWVTPTHCSDYGTLIEERINLEGKNNINEDCILLINRTSKGGIGEYVGISGYYNFSEYGKGHHNQGMYRLFNYPKHNLLFILCFLNCSLMRKYCAALSVGSKMKELKIEQFLQIPIPNFPETKQKEIALLYHNPESIYQTDTFTLDNFLERDNAFNEKAGIYELDKTAKQLKEILNKAIDDIVNDREVTINFNL